MIIWLSKHDVWSPSNPLDACLFKLLREAALLSAAVAIAFLLVTASGGAQRPAKQHVDAASHEPLGGGTSDRK